MKLSKDTVASRLSSYQNNPVRPSNQKSSKSQKYKVSPLATNRAQNSLIRASVLIPLINRSSEISVILTKRDNNLKYHAGQISFPGGKRDANDINSKHTALRETSEEIGLSDKQIEVVGRLDDYVIGTGFLVAPFVGFVNPPFEFAPQKNEVSEILEAPLSFLTNPINIKQHIREIDGKERRFFAIQWEQYYIWGATAGMLRDLSQRLWICGK